MISGSLKVFIVVKLCQALWLDNFFGGLESPPYDNASILPFRLPVS
ncbi:MAG: hypothetical protein IKX14_03445 [Neisseriaceae bacterium]|nr:hypothetical protein [Neisseriaceae bacterium]